MARILLIITIVLGLGAAFLGFKSKQQADIVQADLKQTRSTLATTKNTLKKTEEKLKETEDTLKTTQDTLKAREEELTNTKGQLDTAKADLAKAQAEVEEKSKKIADAEAALEKLKASIPGGVDLATLPERLAQLQAEREKAINEARESQEVAKALKVRVDETQAQVENEKIKVKAYQDGFVRNGLSGKVVAYNPGWNFVVLNIGDKSGLKPGVSMVVVRGGNMIGKVKVTSVEPSTSIADVLPGTIVRGESVQPGDQVVFQGDRR